MILNRPILPPCVFCCLLAAATTAPGNPLQLEIGTEPAGAEVSVGGVVLGVTPLKRSAVLANSGSLTLTITKPGYESVTRSVPLSEGKARVEIKLSRARGRIVINAFDDRPPDNDGLVTLREALAYARGDRTPRGADLNQLHRPFGRGSAEDIVFDSEVFSKPRWIVVTSPLPALDDPGDELIGPQAPLTVMPAPGSAKHRPGIQAGPFTGISNLALDGFDIGIAARGFGDVHLRNIRIPSAVVGVQATNGADVIADDVMAAVEFVPRLVADGGVIDGPVELIDTGTPGEATMRIESCEPEDLVRVVGWHDHQDEVPRLYVRAAEPCPLHQVPGISVDGSSYTAYRIFSVEANQNWPKYVVDGNHQVYFQWEFRRPANQEWLTIIVQRPIRTEKLTIRHLQIEGHKLIKYRLSLHDRFRKEVFHKDVTAGESVDEIDIDPELDFFRIHIQIVEAQGGTPGISEIEASVLDSMEVVPLAHSRRQIVFPRPEQGERAAVAIGRHLYPLGERAFADNATFKQEQVVGPRRFLPRCSVEVESAGDEVKADDQLTLREAILFINGERKLSPDERRFVEGTPDRPVRVSVTAERIQLSDSLPPIRHEDVELHGENTELTAVPGAPWALTFEGSRRVGMRRFDLLGGITIRGATIAQLRDVSITKFGDTAVMLTGGQAYLHRCRIAEGEVGLHAETGGVHVVDSLFENLQTGADLDLVHGVVAIGNRFVNTATPLNLRGDRGSLPQLVLAGNEADGDAVSRLVNPEIDGYKRDRYPAVFINNKPPRLGLTDKLWVSGTRTLWPEATLAMRTGSGASAIQHVDLVDGDAWVVIPQEDRAPFFLRSPFATLFYDGPTEIWCHSAGAVDIRLLLPPGAAWPADSVASKPALKSALGISVFTAAPDHGTDAPADVLTSFDASMLTKDLAQEPLVLERPETRKAQSLISLVRGLVAEGDHELALKTALDGRRRFLGVASVRKLVTWAGAEWVGHLESQSRFDEAGELILALKETVRDDSSIDQMLSGHKHRYAAHLLDKKQWESARDILAELQQAGDTSKFVQQNLVYVYREWAKKRLQTEPLDKVVAWLDEAANQHKPLADRIRQTASVALNSLLHEALDQGKVKTAFDLAGNAYELDPSSTNQQNLVFAFQEWMKKEIGETGVTSAARALAAARKRFPKVDKLPGILISVANSKLDQQLKEGQWESARDFLTELDKVEDAREFVQQKFTHVHREWAKQRLQTESLDKVLAWLEETANKHESMGDPIRRTASALVGDLLHEAFDKGEVKTALELAGKAFELEPDKSSRQNLAYAFQERIRKQIDEGHVKDAANALAVARKRFPKVEELTGTLISVVNSVVEAKINAGDSADAVAISGELLAALTTDTTQKLHAYCLNKHAETVLSQDGFDKAWALFSDAVTRFPKVSLIRTQAGAFANREAVRLSETKNYEGMVQVLARGLAVDPNNETLSGNLRIGYLNWSVSLANGKQYADAVRVAEQGLKRFPGDTELTQVRDVARQRQ